MYFMNELDKTARIIQQRRKEMKMSQRELARRLGVQPTTISRWETAQGYPDQGIIAKLAFELGISTDELYGTKDIKMQKPERKKFTWLEFFIILVKAIVIGAIIALLVYSSITNNSKKEVTIILQLPAYARIICSIVLFILATILIVCDRFKKWIIRKTYRFRYKHEFPVGYEFKINKKYLLFLNIKYALVTLALVLLMWLS